MIINLRFKISIIRINIAFSMKIRCNTYSPLGKITSQGRLEDVPEKRPDVLRTSPCGPISNSKAIISSRTSLGRTQDDNLKIIHKMSLYDIFPIFSDFYCVSDIAPPN